jgi:hypothetical protein
LATGILPQNVIGAKRVIHENRFAHKQGLDEGVVSVKALTNEMVSTLYTSGLFKVWSVTTGKCITSKDLFENI